jgi:deoxyribodipyrimidine photo-lyase
LKTGAGGFFRVYTPFWRAARNLPPPPSPTPPPRKIDAAAWPKSFPQRVDIANIELLPATPDWAGGLRERWRPGEGGAHARLTEFIDERIARYSTGRDRPDLETTSMLSPHLRFGEISPRQILAAARHADAAGKAKAGDVDKFLSEIGWREFAYHLLYHAPNLATKNFVAKFDGFPWRTPDKVEIRAWQRGQTGYPIVDAGMRELWTTGYMHNRVRMICASFLVKDLLVDWRVGERWFWDTLCDADPANNAASWQWVAGSGADAAPYFRVFNPILQSEKFDTNGDYVRRYVPELAGLAAKYIHKPWLAPDDALATAGVKIGRDYPAPIVDHMKARDRALAALSSISS